MTPTILFDLDRKDDNRWVTDFEPTLALVTFGKKEDAKVFDFNEAIRIISRMSGKGTMARRLSYNWAE